MRPARIDRDLRIVVEEDGEPAFLPTQHIGHVFTQEVQRIVDTADRQWGDDCAVRARIERAGQVGEGLVASRGGHAGPGCDGQGRTPESSELARATSSAQMRMTDCRSALGTRSHSPVVPM